MIRTAFFSMSLAIALSAAEAQAFDCAQAKTSIEKTICASPALKRQDDDLNQAYSAALARDPAKADDLRRAQRMWLVDRDRACASSGVEACLERWARDRLALLNAQLDRAPRTPEARAVFSCASVPANGSGETFLNVLQAGRFAVRVESRTGIALQIVDMITGPGQRVGEPGVSDGRLDLLLDVGVYKLRAFGPKLEGAPSYVERSSVSVCPPAGAQGRAALSVQPFREAEPPSLVLMDGGEARTQLKDLQQRSYWITVPAEGDVRLEAIGRGLQDLRLWRNASDLSELTPQIRTVEPRPGRPMTHLLLQGKVEPGPYLVTAYGGAPARWTSGAAEEPFHIRTVKPASLAAIQVEGRIGPFGVERFQAPPGARYFRLDLPQIAPARLSVFRKDGPAESAGVEKASREPVAIVRSAPSGAAERIVEASGYEGQTFRLVALNPDAPSVLRGVGPHAVAVELAGEGGDEIPATVLLLASLDGQRETRVLASNAPRVGPSFAWRRRFNLRGVSTILFEASESMQAVVRASGPAVKTTIEPVIGVPPPPNAEGRSSDVQPLEAGWHRLTIEPLDGASGVIDLTIGPAFGGVYDPPVAIDPPRTFIPLGEHVFENDKTYFIVSNAAPSLTTAPVFRASPPDLQQAPFALVQESGQRIETTVRIPNRGTVAAFEPNGAPAAIERIEETLDGSGQKISLDNGSRWVRLAIQPVGRSRRIALVWSDPPERIKVETPVLEPSATLEALKAGSPRYYDIKEGERRGLFLDVSEGGLYRVETTGRLKTAASLSTPFIPNLASAQADGAGGNALLQTYLRAGRYRVAISAVESSGRFGVSASPAPLPEASQLSPGASVRARLAEGRGVVFPLSIAEAGPYRLDLVGLKQTFSARLEDEDGWPLAPPGPLSSLTQSFEPGRYRLVVLPTPVEAQIVARLTSTAEPAPLEGHGPHRVAFNAVQTHQWREPPGRAERTPDAWTFTLKGPTDVKAAIGDGMIAELLDEDTRRPIAKFIYKSDYSGRLEAGRYLIEARSLGRNDRLDYDLEVSAVEIQPGETRRLKLPASVPFSIADDRIVSLTTFGAVDLHATLSDAQGRVIERLDDRTDDWNVALSRPLRAGSYRLDLAAVVPSSGSDEYEASDEEEEGEPEEIAEDDKEAVELRLALPEASEEPEGALSRPVSVSGDQAARLYRLPIFEPGVLILAAAQSKAEIALALERQERDGRWSLIALERGLSPIAAAPADGDPARPWRVAVWRVDGGDAPIGLSVKPVRQSPQPIDRPVAFQNVDMEMAGVSPDPERRPRPRIALAQSIGAEALVLNEEIADLKQGSVSGRALGALSGRILAPQSDRLWLMTAAETTDRVILRPVGTPPAEGLALVTPADGAATLPQPPPVENRLRIWRADSAFGQPGLFAGRGMGAAPGGAVAVGAPGAPVRLFNAGGGEPLRARLFLTDVELAPQTPNPMTSFSAVLPPGRAQNLRLAGGGKRVILNLPAGALAAFGAGQGGRDPTTVWTGSEPVSRTLEGEWTDLLLVNLGDKPAPVSVFATPLPAPARLEARAAFKRFFGAAGSFTLSVDGRSGDRLLIAGGEATFVGFDGKIRRGGALAIDGAGQATIAHGAGLVAAWIERAGASPWPVSPPRPAPIPSVMRLEGEAMTLALSVREPVLLTARTTAPVIVSLSGRYGAESAPVLFPAGAVFQRYVEAGAAELKLYSPHDGPLAGTLDLSATPIAPLSEGLGQPVAAAPGSASLFGFELRRRGPLGIGVRAEPDIAEARLLDSAGRSLGEGVAQLHPSLEPGRYLLEVRVPVDGRTTSLRPAVVGIDPPRVGPPPDVVAKYLEAAGTVPVRPRRETP